MDDIARCLELHEKADKHKWELIQITVTLIKVAHIKMILYRYRQLIIAGLIIWSQVTYIKQWKNKNTRINAI